MSARARKRREAELAAESSEEASGSEQGSGEEDGEESDDGSEEDDDDEEDEGSDSSEGFEDQGSSSDEDDIDDGGGGGSAAAGGGAGGDADSDEEQLSFETAPRTTAGWNVRREKELQRMNADGSLALAQHMDTADISSDDEEGNRNTVGNVPLRWYEDYKHFGYGRDGKRLGKSERGDGIDAALANEDDPNFDRTVYDEYNDKEIVLSDRDLLLIERMLEHKHVHPEHDANPDYVDFYSRKIEIHALDQAPEPKRRFIPSKWERMRVMKIVKGIHEGRIKLEKDKKPKKEKKQYLMWTDADTAANNNKGPMHVPAPKMPLPGHAESYNPPDEYLMTPEEEKKW
jgi:ribosome biogenesis protein ERB1